MHELLLGDNEIESLVNGGSIQRKLSDGTIIKISQSLMKDTLALIINHDKKIYSSGEIANIKRVTGAISSAMKLGV